jgi:hypothetical protein
LHQTKVKSKSWELLMAAENDDRVDRVDALPAASARERSDRCLWIPAITTAEKADRTKKKELWEIGPSYNDLFSFEVIARPVTAEMCLRFNKSIIMGSPFAQTEPGIGLFTFTTLLFSP